MRLRKVKAGAAENQAGLYRSIAGRHAVMIKESEGTIAEHRFLQRASYVLLG